MEDSHHDTSFIRGVMIQKKEALGLIKHKMMQLEEEAKSIEGDLIRFAAAHLPHKHNLLPNEILARIFVLAAQDYGAVSFPMPRTKIPPQLAASHVCSHWRMVALCTPKLWSNTSLHYPADNLNVIPVVHLHQRWLMRAGILPVTLSIKFKESGMVAADIACQLEKILSPFHVKRLLLDMTHEQFVALWDFPETALSRIMEVELEVTVCRGGNTDINSPHHLVAQLRSVKLRGNVARCLDKLSPILPWSQLRCLEYHEDIGRLQLVVGVLRQIPMLQRLVLTTAETAIAPEELTMPSLQEFILETCVEMIDGIELDRILRGFALPSLTKFSLYTKAYWTSDTYEIIKRQYNLQKLQEVGFLGCFTLPVSFVLYNSPMLHSLRLDYDAILDDDAITGISNGTLGRFLKVLELSTACDRDIEEVLGMANARKKTVDRLIENGCTWKEEVTVLSYIEIDGEYDIDKYKEKVKALRAQGIEIHVIR